MRGQRNLWKVGAKFGKLEIKRVWSEQFPHHKSKETVCECVCQCGKTLITRTRYLRHHKKTCGCGQNPGNSKHPCWKGHGQISGSQWEDIKKGANRRARVIPFDLTIEQAWDLFLKQGGKCALSGVEIVFPKLNRRFDPSGTASLDRIDSLLGYTAANVQWVHKEVNLMKMSLTQESFLRWCELIARNKKEIPGE